MGYNSLQMKIGNFTYLDGKGGLYGYTRASERAFVKYREYADDDLLRLSLPAVERAGERYFTRLKLNIDRLQLEIDGMVSA